MSDKMFDFLMTHAWWVLIIVLSAAPIAGLYIIGVIVEVFKGLIS